MAGVQRKFRFLLFVLLSFHINDSAQTRSALTWFYFLSFSQQYCEWYLTSLNILESKKFTNWNITEIWSIPKLNLLSIWSSPCQRFAIKNIEFCKKQLMSSTQFFSDLFYFVEGVLSNDFELFLLFNSYQLTRAVKLWKWFHIKFSNWMKFSYCLNWH